MGGITIVTRRTDYQPPSTENRTPDCFSLTNGSLVENCSIRSSMNDGAPDQKAIADAKKLAENAPDATLLPVINNKVSQLRFTDELPQGYKLKADNYTGMRTYIQQENLVPVISYGRAVFISTSGDKSKAEEDAKNIITELTKTPVGRNLLSSFQKSQFPLIVQLNYPADPINGRKVVRDGNSVAYPLEAKNRIYDKDIIPVKTSKLKQNFYLVNIEPRMQHIVLSEGDLSSNSGKFTKSDLKPVGYIPGIAAAVHELAHVYDALRDGNNYSARSNRPRGVYANSNEEFAVEATKIFTSQYVDLNGNPAFALEKYGLPQRVVSTGSIFDPAWRLREGVR